MKPGVLAIAACLLFEANSGRSADSQNVHTYVRTLATTDGRVTVVHLAPRYATAIRMHEPISSVVVGDPASFLVEHNEQEANLVFVKPIASKPSQTNLLISTVRGRQASVLLISRGELEANDRPAIDFLVSSPPPRRFLIEQAEYPSVLIAETVSLGEPRGAPVMRMPSITETERTSLDGLLDRQRRAPLPRLYEGEPGISNPEKVRIKAGVSEVVDQGREVVVLFSILNPQRHAIEIMPPQIQLGGKVRSGWLIKRSRWGTAEQLPILDYRLSRRRLGPEERADGVVVFNRPPYKQSNETLFLQMAESGAVDRPALAPIGFGIGNFNLIEGGSHGRASTQERQR